MVALEGHSGHERCVEVEHMECKDLCLGMHWYWRGRLACVDVVVRWRDVVAWYLHCV